MSEVESMANNTEKYKKLFLAEADEKIAALNTAFLALEKKPGDSTFATDAMRAAHTLKSSAAAMNFMEMSHLAHAMEDVFEEVRTKKRPLSPVAIETLFAAVDMFSTAISSVKKGGDEPSTQALIKKLEGLISKPAGATKQGNAAEPQEQSNIELAQKPDSIAPIEAIKVDVATLDKLMNLTEELLVEKMRLSEIVRRGKERPDKKLDVTECESSSEVFSRLISELQLNVTQARMVPLGQLFERFPRMMRDLAHVQNKEVDFQIKGQDIELDRTVIDRLGEPLIHLLRNAVDHGIEKTGTIQLNATRERDKVIIEVINEGRPIDWQKVVDVAVKRGIISNEKRTEYTKNLQPTTYNLQPELQNLLYRVSTKDKVTETSGRGVGLSIVKSVTESLGGRVTIESPSATGATMFRMQLPLTIAIIQALLVRVSNQTFAIPFVAMDRSVRVTAQNIKKALDQEVAMVEGEDIPMVRLDTLFGIQKKRMGLFLSEEEVEAQKNKTGAELMVIAKREDLLGSVAGPALVGLMVDELLSKQDIVVKPLKGTLKQSKGFAGVTLLGDGRPALILDVATLI